MAAVYAYGIAKNQPFIDGNKRTAFMTCMLFLYCNGYHVNASLEDCYITFLKLAAGDINESELISMDRKKFTSA